MAVNKYPGASQKYVDEYPAFPGLQHNETHAATNISMPKMKAITLNARAAFQDPSMVTVSGYALQLSNAYVPPVETTNETN